MAFSNHDDGELLGEINMVPLIDVMLVLLIVFIVTVPVIRHAAQVELPRASSQRSQETARTIRLGVAAGGYLWNGDAIGDAELDGRLQSAAAGSQQTALQLHADRAVSYERVAQALAAAQRAGIGRIGFVTQP